MRGVTQSSGEKGGWVTESSGEGAGRERDGGGTQTKWGGSQSGGRVTESSGEEGLGGGRWMGEGTGRGIGGSGIRKGGKECVLCRAEKSNGMVEVFSYDGNVLDSGLTSFAPVSERRGARSRWRFTVMF